MTDTARANMSSVDATRSALEAAYDALKAFPDGQEPSGTAKLILEAVEDVLCEEGAEQFSMRSVAGRAGISLAALQYHFGSKRDLLGQYFKLKNDEYHKALRPLIVRQESDPERAIRATIGFFAKDSVSERTHALYSQLLAISTHDEIARAAMQKHMEVYHGLMALLVARLEPQASDSEIFIRAAAIVSMMEGLGTFGFALRQRGRLSSATITRLADFAIAIAAG